MDVCVRLREATAGAHADAERHAFVRQLFGSAPSRAVYAAYLTGLARVYAALEQTIAARCWEYGFLADARLARHGAILEDLAAVAPKDARTRLPKVSLVYAERIRIVGEEPPRLAAHAYVRYLGDLAGGQQMGRKVQAAFGGAEDVSRMYRFEGFESTREAATRVREELTRFGADEASATTMVREAVEAFVLTRAMFDEVMCSPTEP